MIAAMTTNAPKVKQQYRNRVTIPGYSPGNLIVELTAVTDSTVTYTTIESNRLRHGPFIGLTGTLTLAELERDWEYMMNMEETNG
jgi:hypothetical protein